MWYLALSVVVSNLLASIGDPGTKSDNDCRRAAYACANGFACRQVSEGTWDCVEAPPPATPTDAGTSPPPTAAPASVPCPENPKCVGRLATDAHGRSLCYSCTCDSGGRILRVETDRICDGTPDFLDTMAYDSQGRLIRSVHVEHGVTYSIETRTYDSRGYLLKIEADANENPTGPCDGIIDGCWLCTPACPPPYEDCNCVCEWPERICC